MNYLQVPILVIQLKQLIKTTSSRNFKEDDTKFMERFANEARRYGDDSFLDDEDVKDEDRNITYEGGSMSDTKFTPRMKDVDTSH